MSDTSTTNQTTQTTTETATKTPRHHGLLDKHQLAEISHAGVIYGVAGDSAIFDQIKDDQIITPEFMTGFGNDLQFISQYTGGASEAAIGAAIETNAEAIAKSALLEKIHYIQSKARLKYAGANPGVLAEYGMGKGQNITVSRPALEAAAGNIINKLKTDTLPKITAQHAADLQTALDAYRKAKVDQVGGKGDATTLRQKLADMVVSLAARRRQLQHAADGEYSYTDPANAGMRRKFDLPANRPLNP